MHIEEAMKLLKDFQKGKIEKDKLEVYKGGFKMGYFYTVYLQEAIESLFKEREQDKAIIEELEKEQRIKLIGTLAEVRLEEIIKTDYISKEKIQEKIDEIRERKMLIITSLIHNTDEKLEILRKDIIKKETLQELLEDKGE